MYTRGEALSAQGLKRSKRLITKYLEGHGRIVGTPPVVEVVTARAPPTAKPTEAADTKIATSVPKARCPEEDSSFFLPFFLNEMRMHAQRIQNVRVEYRLPCQIFTKLVTSGGLSVLLAIGTVENDLAIVAELTI